MQRLTTQVSEVTHLLSDFRFFIGPGTYAAEKVKVIATVKDMMSNSFSTKVSARFESLTSLFLQIPRFCPTAPGSSVYKPPSYIQNPGPGTHFKSLKFTGLPSDLDKSREKYLSNKHKEQVNKPKVKPPSIPAKKVSQNMYTGSGHDTVGPAVYNPNTSTVKPAAPVGDFQTSKTQRKVFEAVNHIEN